MNRKILIGISVMLVLLTILAVTGYAHANHRYQDYSLKEKTIQLNEWIPEKGYNFKIIDFYKEKTEDPNWSNLVFTLKINKKAETAYFDNLFSDLFVTSEHTNVGQYEGVYDQQGHRLKKIDQKDLFVIKFENFEKKITASEQIELDYLKRDFPNYIKYRFFPKKGN